MSRPPALPAVAWTVPLWTAAMEKTKGETEAESVVAGAIVEPGERQEQALDLVGWYNRAGVDDAHE